MDDTKIEMFDIYVKFRQSQSRFLNRPYRLPKDFELFVKKRMSENSRKYLESITQRFNTRWVNIDIDRYFDYGFELFGKSFSYNKFIDKRLIKYYIEKDKNLKRSDDKLKENFNKSILFLKDWISKNCNNTRISPITIYCNKSDEKVRLPIKHYIRGSIDKLFFTWLIKERYFTPKDYEIQYIPYISENFRSSLEKLNEFNDLIENTRSILENERRDNNKT